MAVSARSVAADAAKAASEWPWHTPLVGSVSVSLMRNAQRRMEAESYLTDGYGVRLAIESKTSGWDRFSVLAKAVAPPRIKQVLVSPENGVPYLNTSQVFDVRPKPRKWLAMAKTKNANERLVKEGTILVMASATVGRAIVATKAHENSIISHHFMRVEPVNMHLSGWIYGYLRSPQALAMMSGSQYASVIRHIEPHHLATLPVPEVSQEIADDFNKRVGEIVACRNKAAAMTESAESTFSEALNLSSIPATENGFSVRLSDIVSRRRRFEGSYHTPRVRAIIEGFKRKDLLGAITSGVWWGNRFKRHYGDNGIPYLSADDVFTTNPYTHRRILVRPEDGHESFFVKKGWLIMACSGQVYGLNGSAMIVTEWHENTFFSHDMIRIEPKEGARAGYLLTALTHPTLGRPLLIREAYGMSIPHLDPGDVAAFPVVRLDPKVEGDIADLAEGAASELAKAEMLERELSEYAGTIISEFLLKPTLSPDDDADTATAKLRLAEIESRPGNLVQGKALSDRLARIK